MENASKALLIAGGVLIALLIITLLIFTVTKLGDNQRAQSSGTKSSQLAEFNRDFDRYTEGTINGTDIISIMNKIDDFNTQRAQINSDERREQSTYINYNEPITLEVNLTGFNSKNSYDTYNANSRLFDNNQTISYNGTGKEGNKIKKIFDNAAHAEDEATISKLKKAYSEYNLVMARKDLSTDEKNKLLNERIREALGDSSWSYNSNREPTLNTIKFYDQYSTFKSSKFESTASPEYYTDGQIKKLQFKFKE